MDVLSFSTIADFVNKKVNSKCGLNISQMRILLFFDKNQNQEISMGELAKEMNISLSTLSRQLQQKKTTDLVEVARSKVNTSKYVKLTEVGIAKAQELKHVLGIIEKAIFSNISKQKLAEFTKELESVTQNLVNLE